MTPKTRIFMNGNTSYDDFKSDKMDQSNNGFNYYIGGGIQQNLPYDLRLSLNGGGSGSSIGLQGKRSGYKYYGISLNKLMLNKRLTISVYARNLFNKNLTFTSTTETKSFRYYSETNYPMRSFGINISYRIGELSAAVKKTAKSIQNDDVKSGGSNTGGGAPSGN